MSITWLVNNIHTVWVKTRAMTSKGSVDFHDLGPSLHFGVFIDDYSKKF